MYVGLHLVGPPHLAGSPDALLQSSQELNLLFEHQQILAQPRGQWSFFSSKEERNFIFWLISSFSQQLIIDSESPPLENGVCNHSLVAEKNFKAEKVSHSVALGLGETDLE